MADFLTLRTRVNSDDIAKMLLVTWLFWPITSATIYIIDDIVVIVILGRRIVIIQLIVQRLKLLLITAYANRAW